MTPQLSFTGGAVAIALPGFWAAGLMGMHPHVTGRGLGERSPAWP